MKNIVLIGMPGSGKTTIGRCLAKKLGLDFFDCDVEITEKQGKSVSQIFSQQGEQVFRNLETDLLKNHLPQSDFVISTGGGIIERAENTEILRDCGIVVFINRPTENILGDIDVTNRPLLAHDINKLNTLFKRRFELYKNACHFQVDNTKDIDDVVIKIIDEVNKNG